MKITDRVSRLSMANGLGHEVDSHGVPDVDVDLFFENEEIVDLLLEEGHQLGQLLDVWVQLVGLPNEADAFSNQVLDLLAQVGHLDKEKRAFRQFLYNIKAAASLPMIPLYILAIRLHQI